jgi:tetratricopeptide (TPR) repeat protein
MFTNIADDLYDLGRFGEGLAWYKRALAADPGSTGGYFGIGVHYAFVTGQLDEAVVWLVKGSSLDSGGDYFQAFLSLIFLDLGDPDDAEYWGNQSMELSPGRSLSNIAMQLLHLYRGEDGAALEYGRNVLGTDLYLWAWWDAVGFSRDQELRAGRYSRARALYESSHPELLSEGTPKIDKRNYRAAINLALVLSKLGDQERADLLLNRSFQYIKAIPRLGFEGRGISDVQIYALQGNKQKALSVLRQAIDEGWRTLWWYFLKHDPNLESLHDEPEFQAMVAEIEADMAAQLERVREMERNGELEPIPEVSATTH